jgi:hypothetical protein
MALATLGHGRRSLATGCREVPKRFLQEGRASDESLTRPRTAGVKKTTCLELLKGPSRLGAVSRSENPVRLALL